MALRKRTVVGTLVKIDGSPLINGTVTFQLTDKLAYTGTHVIVDTPLSVTTNSLGAFSASLWCDDDDISTLGDTTALEYQVQFPASDSGSSQTHTAKFSLRYGTSPINISTLINGGRGGQPWGEYYSDNIDVPDGTIVYTWPDSSANGRDLTMTSFTGNTLELNEINGLPIVKFTSNDHAYRSFSHPIYVYDLFLVMKHRGATFGSLNKVALGDISTEVLTGLAGGTTWTTTSLQYRRNGILQTNPPPAPMNVFDVIHLKWPTGQVFNGVINLGNSVSQGYPVPIDVAAMIVYGSESPDIDFGIDEEVPDHTALTSLEYTEITNQLMKKYAIN